MEAIELKKAEGVELKNGQLAAAAQTILTVYDKTAKMNRKTTETIAIELGKVQKSKSYEEDGFKNAADFAQNYLGMKKSSAYNLAAWGRAILEPDCPAAVKEMGPSNYAAVKSIGYDEVKKAVESGAIGANSTQDELADFAKAKKAEAEDEGGEAKTKVLKRYNVEIPALKRSIEKVTEPDVYDLFKGAYEGDGECDFIKAPAKDGEAKRLICVTPGGLAFVAIFRAVNENTTKHTKAAAKDLERAAAMKRLTNANVDAINAVLGTHFTAADWESWT